MFARDVIRVVVAHLSVLQVVSVTITGDQPGVPAIEGPGVFAIQAPGVPAIQAPGVPASQGPGVPAGHPRPGVTIGTFTTAAAAVRAPAEKITICTVEEKNVLVPVRLLTEKIKTQIAQNGTWGNDIPPECRSTPTAGSLVSCYQAWGFSRGVAQCWAQEALKRSKVCGLGIVGGVCHADMDRHRGPRSLRCQICNANLRAERRRCTFYSMNVSPMCVDCQLAAYEYWDHNCMMECRNAFRDRSAVSRNCRKCSDTHNEMLVTCGAQ